MPPAPAAALEALQAARLTHTSASYPTLAVQLTHRSATRASSNRQPSGCPAQFSHFGGFLSTNCSLRSCHSISVGFRSGPGLSELHSVFLQPLRRGPAGLCWIINSLQHKYRPQPETSRYLFFKKNEIFTITRKHEPLSACEVCLGAQSDGSALQASKYDISKRLIKLLDHKYFRKF